LLEETILLRIRAQPGFKDALAAAEQAVSDGTITVPQAVQTLIEPPNATQPL